MQGTPHHHGSLAYARIGYSGGDEMVINNLQRDADYDHLKNLLKSRRAWTPSDFDFEGVLSAGKKLDNLTRDWDKILLSMVQTVALNMGAEAFLTPSEHQFDKWYHAPRSKTERTYDTVPGQMGFEQSGNLQDSYLSEGGSGGHMWQIAEDLVHWLKTVSCR